MSKIQIAVAYHKKSPIIKNECLYPIHVGRACSDLDLDMPGDDTGDNISAKNFGYAELTAIYWLWKNSDADIKGLFHYRRFLNLKDGGKDHNLGLTEDFSSDKFLSEIEINEEKIYSLFEQYDILTPPCFDIGKSVRTDYLSYGFSEEALDKALEVIQQDYPEYYDTATTVLNGNFAFLFNVFVMDSKKYNEYCSWLFDILFKVESRLNLYSPMFAPSTDLARWAGYLAEHLTDIFIRKQIEDGEKVGEFPLVYLCPDSNTEFYSCNCYDVYQYSKKEEKSLIIENTDSPKDSIVSVCVAVYNAERNLEQCLSSIVNQTLKNTEIIVVDDGSTDKTLDIINDFASKDSRIVVVHQEHQGIWHARNHGIQLARGKYIHLMGAEDCMEKTFLENMVRNAEKYGSDMVVSTYRQVDAQTRKCLCTTNLPHTLLSEKLNIANTPDLMLVPCQVWDKLYKRSLIKDIPFTPEYGEDIYFWCRAVLKAKNISVHRLCEFSHFVDNKLVKSMSRYVFDVLTNIERTKKLLESNCNSEVVGLFNLFRDVLIIHLLFNAAKTIKTDKRFRRVLFKRLKLILSSEHELIPEIEKRRVWYSINFKLIDRLKSCRTQREFAGYFLDKTERSLFLYSIYKKAKEIAFKWLRRDNTSKN